MAPNSNFIFFIILLENQIVIHSFANRAQPSSDKLSSDVSGVVLLGGTCCQWRVHMLQHRFPAVLTNELKFWITHMDMQTRERKHYEGCEKLTW